jgi:hypothetical protein
MNSVDHMIRYLAGELEPVEARALEEAMKTDPEIRKTFERVSDAYRLVGEQLRKRDEAAFANKLRNIMDRLGESSVQNKREHRDLRWIIWPAAAAIVLLAGIMMFRDTDRQTYRSFYHPEEDPFLLAMQDGTRGMQDSLALMFINRQHEALWEETNRILAGDPGNLTAGLFNLLAALELDRETEALSAGWKPDPSAEDPLDRAISWYRALACLKSERVEEAESLLRSLAESTGSYSRDAKKLLRMLTK